MSEIGGADPLYVASRAALLDAMLALGPHARHAVVIGAHAIYLRTGRATTAIAEATKDSDIAIDPRAIPDVPLIEQAMRSGGFRPHPIGQPGMWCTEDDIPVDLMTPEAIAGEPAVGRRGWRMPPHDKNAVRRARGIEPCILDHSPVAIAALDPADTRIVLANVAGPAALVVAKTHKIAERIAERDKRFGDGRRPGRDRVRPKDAHDIYRIMQSTETELLADRFRVLLHADFCRDVTQESMTHLRDLFSKSTFEGAVLAGAAEAGVGDPDSVASSIALLTQDLLAELDRA